MVLAVYSLCQEEVPLTERKQLRLPWVSFAAVPCNAADAIKQELSSGQPLALATDHLACQLVNRLFDQICAGASDMAKQQPNNSLVTQLNSVMALGCYYDRDLSAKASYGNGRPSKLSSLWGGDEEDRRSGVGMSAGMLQRMSFTELRWVMAHEIGHGIAQHLEERRSWRELIAFAVPSRLALSRVKLWSGLAAVFAVTWGLQRLLVSTWLAQTHEYEADELAAAFSSAAGCSATNSLDALGRLVLPEILWSFHLEIQAQRQLESLMPHARLPMTLHNPRDFLQVALAWALQHREDPEADHLSFRRLLQVLRPAAARHLRESNLVIACTSTHPKWQHRMTKLMASNAWTQYLARDIDYKDKQSRDEQLLRAYQDHKQWQDMSDCFLHFYAGASRDAYTMLKTNRSCREAPYQAIDSLYNQSIGHQNISKSLPITVKVFLDKSADF